MERTVATTEPPRISNTGGKLPPSHNDDLRVSIDWLAFTYTPSPDDSWIPGLRSFLDISFGCANTWALRGGWQGYARSATADGALVAWGGDGQRGTVHVELSGAVCARCDNWAAVADWLTAVGATLTRVDIAGDDYAASRVDVDRAVEWYRAGLFRTSVHGRNPSGRLIDDLGGGTGRTLYVGKRENGRLCRVYEKGRQLGRADSPWVRVEVEWRRKDRVLPVDMLLRASEYLSGAFPCLRFFGLVVQAVRTCRKRVEVTVERVVRMARQQAGCAINLLMILSGGDLGETVARLRRSGLPRGLGNADISGGLMPQGA